MPHLAILSCPEPSENMEESPEGRLCHRCAHAVHRADRLDEAGFEALLRRAKTQRVCLEVRPRANGLALAGGAIAAIGLLGVGCASHGHEEVVGAGALDSAVCDERDQLPGGKCESEWEPVAVFDEDIVIACDAPPPQADFAPSQVETGLELGGSLRGLMTDADSGKPVPHVYVRLESPLLAEAIEAQTDENGRYRIDGLPPGGVQVQVSYAIFIEDREVSIALEKTTVANFEVNVMPSYTRGVVMTVDASAVQ